MPNSSKAKRRLQPTGPLGFRSPVGKPYIIYNVRKIAKINLIPMDLLPMAKYIPNLDKAWVTYSAYFKSKIQLYLNPKYVNPSPTFHQPTKEIIHSFRVRLVASYMALDITYRMRYASFIQITFSGILLFHWTALFALYLYRPHQDIGMPHTPVFL